MMKELTTMVTDLVIFLEVLNIREKTMQQHLQGDEMSVDEE